MPNYDFLFVDESGDPGYKLEPESGRLLSSPYYTTAVLHVCDDSLPLLTQHMANFRFYLGLRKELKSPPGTKEFTGLMDPIRAFADMGASIWASAVYLDKARYTGNYLKPGGTRAANPIRFRNYVLRRLLEFHVARHPIQSGQYDLILDRYDMSLEQEENLVDYLAGNSRVPTPAYITHASSAYVEGLQLVHHIASGFKDVAEGGATPLELSFVDAWDISVQ